MTEPALVLVFDPPVGLTPMATRVTNASRHLRATVVDTAGREHSLAPGESVAATFVLGTIAGAR